MSRRNRNPRRLTPPSTTHDNRSVRVAAGSGTATNQELVTAALAAADELLSEVAAVRHTNPQLDPDTVRHVLALLRLDPLTRLNRSLLRGRAAALHRP